MEIYDHLLMSLIQYESRRYSPMCVTAKSKNKVKETKSQRLYNIAS